MRKLDFSNLITETVDQLRRREKQEKAPRLRLARSITAAAQKSGASLN
jgi:hypothetical protein